MNRSLIPWRRKAADVAAAREADNPFALLHREMNDVFDHFLRDFEGPFRPAIWSGSRGLSAVNAPSVDISETEDEVQVAAELPGMTEKDVEVSLDDDLLTIKGEKKAEHEEKKRNYHLVERSFGQFQRSIPLPSGVDRSKVKARFRNGVLTVSLPKTTESKKQKKTIEITAG